MTFEETGVIMDILQTAYPRFYSGPNAPDKVKTLRLWAEMFARDDVALVAAAVKGLIETDGNAESRDSGGQHRRPGRH